MFIIIDLQMNVYVKTTTGRCLANIDIYLEDDFMAILPLPMLYFFDDIISLNVNLRLRSSQTL